jgi:hypothetical protein
MLGNNTPMIKNPKNQRHTLAERGLPSMRELRKRADADEIFTFMGAEAE